MKRKKWVHTWAFYANYFFVYGCFILSFVVSAATVHSVAVGTGASGSVTSNDCAGYPDNIRHVPVHHLLLLPLLFGEKYFDSLVDGLVGQLSSCMVGWLDGRVFRETQS